MLEIAEHNKGDDCFTEKMIDVLNLVANAHQYFILSNAPGKRHLIKTVFSTIKLTGKKLDFMLHSPFDSFVNLSKIEEWLPVSYVLRTLNEYRLALIQATLKPFYALMPAHN
ncbi:MAG TPA: recombinase RecB [Rickettsia endosymbiont of Omalisus fontisbellaquei]|nr:recombinase RecB [Rickettsia endosymbiont of Omalisus fontisbellaquei]